MTFPINDIRKDFPVLDQTMRGKPLVYLDTAASAQKPQSVIDQVAQFYQQRYSSVHRGLYELSEQATLAFDGARQKVANFIQAKPHEIVFVRGATEAINLVSQSFGQAFLQPNDRVLITEMEHHANIVPWQLLKNQIGIEIDVCPIDEQGVLDVVQFESLLTPQTKLVSVTMMSNVLGTINPIKQLIKLAHKQNIPVLLDACQSIVHQTIDVQDLNCDFLAFSGHKLYGPSGVGVLYGKADYLERMPPYQGGGSMIEQVSFEKSTYQKVPMRFEAGTPNIEGAIGLGAACDYLSAIGQSAIHAHEHALFEYATTLLQPLTRVRIIGEAPQRGGLISFVVEGVHPHDVSAFLDDQGVAVRAGHHCAMPLMTKYQLSSTVRMSLGLYSTAEDIEVFVEALKHVMRVFD